MSRLERDMIKLIEAHKDISKAELTANINKVMADKGRGRYKKAMWISKVTGSPIGTVNTWFCNSKCREDNKIPLQAMCRIALKLKVSVWDFLQSDNELENETKQTHIDRRCKLYRSICKNEASDLWNSTHTDELEHWEHQSKEVQKAFLDKLYLERLENTL